MRVVADRDFLIAQRDGGALNMGQLTTWHYLVILVLVTLFLSAVAIFKPDTFRKMIIVVAIVSAGPLSFAAVNLIAKHLPASRSISDDSTASASTDASEAAPEARVPITPQHPPPKAAPPRPSNPHARFAKQDAPACLFPGDLDKFDHLVWANRTDLASKLNCVIIPQGTEVIPLDSFADLEQVIWERNGETIELWSREYNFKRR